MRVFFDDAENEWRLEGQLRRDDEMLPIVETTLDNFSRMWAMNVTSAFLCSREAARNLQTRRSAASTAGPEVESSTSRLGPLWNRERAAE